MTKCAVLMLIMLIALTVQLGRPASSSSSTGGSLEPDRKPYEKSGPIQYGEDPAQALMVNYYPEGRARAAIVLVTGWTAGPFAREQDTPQLYEDLRLAFVRISHRSLNDFPPPTQMNDAMAGLRYLKAHAHEWNVDPDRLAVTGQSSGGHLAMMVCFHPDAPDVAAVVAHSAPTDFDPGFLRRINPEMLKLPIFEKLFGEGAKDWDSEGIKEKARKLSPVTYMSPDDPPTLFMAQRHGPPPPDLTRIMETTTIGSPSTATNDTRKSADTRSCLSGSKE